jgi:hypothetical protein
LKRYHIVAFLLGWAFSLIYSPSHILAMGKGKS